ncbi:MAG: nuclear transport factor 2 family protein [Candidatus Acidiferrum sp.]|jgi:ketosteroid isomerase-like protein
MDVSRNFLLHGRLGVLLFLALALVLTTGSPAAAQKKKKTTTPADNGPTVPLPDEQQIDYNISEMLGAWQLGDSEKMHKDYADDVAIVNGIYAPPVLGWNNYLALYQQQRARMQRVRLDRANTFIKVDGNVAWACYQWDFAAVVDDKTATAQGQTTLVFEKRDGHWLIVLNHTSLVQPTPQSAEPAAAPKPADPPPPAKPSSR